MPPETGLREPTEHSRVLRWGRVLSQTLSLHLWPREVQYPWNNSQPRRGRCWWRGDPAFSSPLLQGAPKVTSQTTRTPVLVPESALVGIQTMGHVNGWISSSRKVYPHSDRSPQMHRLCISFSGGQSTGSWSPWVNIICFLSAWVSDVEQGFSNGHVHRGYLEICLKYRF